MPVTARRNADVSKSHNAARAGVLGRQEGNFTRHWQLKVKSRGMPEQNGVSETAGRHRSTQNSGR